MSAVGTLLREFPVVAIIGSRQVGKSTLARLVAGQLGSGQGPTGAQERAAPRPGIGPVVQFDLEDPRDRARLADPMLALQDLAGLVVLDEVQHAPNLFEVLRVLADRPNTPARFLVLGSASPDLLRQTAESLAGRIAYHVLPALRLDEIKGGSAQALWTRGGYPSSYLAESEEASVRWRQQFVNTFLTRDLPQLGITTSSETMRRLWTMLAHTHGQTLNASRIGRSLGVSDTSVRRYVDTLTSTFTVRQLQPWHENLGKRQVKSPKIYISDTGILHTLLGLDTSRDVEGHPSMGASWESFIIGNVIARLKSPPDRVFFWATHAGAELDLLVLSGGRRRGFEINRTVSPKVTRSMMVAMADLELDSLEVIHAGADSYPLKEGIQAVSAWRLWEDLE